MSVEKKDCRICMDMSGFFDMLEEKEKENQNEEKEIEQHMRQKRSDP